MKRYARLVAITASLYALHRIGQVFFFHSTIAMAVSAALSVLCPVGSFTVPQTSWPATPWLSEFSFIVCFLLWAIVIHALCTRKRWGYLLAILLLVTCAHLYRSYSSIDGFQGLIWRTVTGEDTQYAAGYRDHGFVQVTNGMSRDHVYRLLGPPLNVWTNEDNSIGERWTKSPRDGNYRCRVVLFTNSVVIERHSEFYED
jgi:hypothetical protein